MAILMAFAFVAGAATALSPCVLPVLPVVLSAGVTGGRRRPLGVVCGLALSFTFATVALVYVIDALGLPDDLVRTLAIVVLLAFGAALLVPRASARIEAWLSHRLSWARPVRRAGGGFASGFVLGVSLGLVYAPCAGPILAGVITVSATQELAAERLAVAFAYGAGTAVVLYAVMLGGRRLASRLSDRAGRFQMATGAVMVIVAVLMFAGYDTRFQAAIADDLPALLVNPSKPLEESASASSRIAQLRAGDREPSLPVFGRAPDFTGTGQWFNTTGGRALSLSDLRGKVVLVDFWTYTCINCLRTLPYLKAWDARYRDDGLVIVGVHSPEFPFERDAGNVRRAIEDNGLRYPVAQDNDFATWDAYRNRYWPAEYFIDARGLIRHAHFGEGDYERKEQIIRSLLAEAGSRPSPAAPTPEGEPAIASTPESYLGAARAARFNNGPITEGLHSFRWSVDPTADHLAYSGRWRIGAEAATAVQDAQIHLSFGARRVFLVLGSRGDAPRAVRVSLDGRPIEDADAGRDVHDGTLTVRRHRLYSLVDLPGPEAHVLRVDLDPGVSGYAFTFG